VSSIERTAMPDFGIVDSHLHLWHPEQLSYGWLRENDLLNRPYQTADYQRDCGDVNVAAMVFVECAVNPGLYEREVRFVEQQAAGDPRIQAIIAQARLEDGTTIVPFLERLKSTTPLLRGTRRMFEAHADIDFCLRSDFIAGVKALGSLGLSFEITVNYRHMDNVLRFVERVGDIPLMLDHCGKPGIREGRFEPWRSRLRSLATHSNVRCKLSGLTTEADHRSWTDEQIQPFVEAVVEGFGFDRLVYGSDWPVCLQSTSIRQWVGLLDGILAGVDARDLRQFYRNNAIDFYKLDIPRI
jgi:L-fuconolactonase